ncbi:MAG: hypothetical protein ACO1SV_00185 [Fimbriimonas sp.]
MRLRRRDEISGIRLVTCVFATLLGLICTPIAYSAYSGALTLLDSPREESRAAHEALARSSKILLVGSAFLLVAGPAGFLKRSNS